MKVLQLFLLFLFPLVVFSQELPPIEVFTTADYHGESQNWMITQSPNKNIYIANDQGLLEYNGERWRMYASPNNTIIRAVKVVQDLVYTGAYMEFGYWKKDPKGNFHYTSLLPKLNEKMIEDEHIWNIITYNEWVLFKSLNRIYFYNTNTEEFDIIDSDNTIINTQVINDKVYYNVADKGVFVIEGGKSSLLIKDYFYKNDKIINLFQKDQDLLIVTQKSGLFIYKDHKISKWKTEADKLLSSLHIYSSLQLQNGGILLGSIAKGLVYLDENGKILYHFNQNNGLNDNTVLSLFEDVDKNIWVGLDDGLNCININSPIKIYSDKKGKLGTVYTSATYNNKVYLGTNQGLFYKEKDGNRDFQLIEGTRGQVWSLFEFNGDLFCGHHKGTFQILDNEAILIANISGTWNFKEIPGSKNQLLQGNYNGLYIINKTEGEWKLERKIQGVNFSVRFFEIMDHRSIWLNHGYRGVFRLSLDSEWNKINEINKDTLLTLSRNTSLVKFNKDLFYQNNKGVFMLDTLKNIFVIDTLLTPLVSGDAYFSGKMVVDRTNKLWLFSKESVIVVSVDNLTNQYKYELIDIPVFQRKANTGYENVSHFDKNSYLLGTSNGYIKLDLSNTKVNTSEELYLNEITVNPLGSQEIHVNLKKSGDFSFKQNSIVFRYNVPRFNKYLKVKYQYKLIGYYDQWSNWSEKSEVDFDNLSFGSYELKVKARIGNEPSINSINYKFIINRPWSLSNVALIIYSIITILIGFLIHRSYKKYYNKKNKEKQLKNERLIMKINNDKLRQDIENKNREMAISMMNIVKRNKMLNQIKKELKEINSCSSKISSVLKLIDQNLNNKKDMEKFEDAFNNTDKHFFDKVKKAHPNLAPNDIRFCAYLRLNLSSKEIAPLLNISVRSVEIKRYRLRKKMNLSHDEGLVDHILNI